MDNRQEILDEELDNINGGKITFTWSSKDNIGTIGIDNNNMLVLLDKGAFSAYINSPEAAGKTDGAILKELVARGIAKKP